MTSLMPHFSPRISSASLPLYALTMPRYKLTLEYDGGPFVGWQRQDNGLAVQQVLEDAIQRFSGETVRTQTAGRTDAGVHALGQVVHADLTQEFPADTVRDALNFHLRPAPIAVLTAVRVCEAFQARFSAIRRHYLYRIVSRRPPTPLRHGRVWHVAAALDVDAMHEASQALLGKHDFSTFRATQCQAKSPVKTLEAISVRPHDDEIHLRVSAKSFLHHQVRSFAGSLRRVGDGGWPVEAIAEILAKCDRKACGPVAPPDGLYLARVDYED